MVVISSTRATRVGLPVAHWFVERAEAHGGFDVHVVDLVDVGLPLFDEPYHPRRGEYVHEHTKRWSALVAGADAFAFVTPEYNHGLPASLKNALDFLHAEWKYKPVGFVSYGGVSGGTRAVQMAKPVVAALRMTAVAETVPIAFVSRLVHDAGRFQAEATHEQAADAMLDELARVEAALRPLRLGAATPDGRAQPGVAAT